MLILNKDYQESYIGEVSEQGGIIHWDYNKSPEFVLLIQYPYGFNYQIGEIITRMNNKNMEPIENVDTEIETGVFCRLLRNIQNRRAYRVQVAPATYYILGCSKVGDDLIVFEEIESYKCQCSIAAKVTYRIETIEETRQVRSFFRKQVITCSFSKVIVDSNEIYQDGALSYGFEGIPIVFAISKNDIGKPIFIKHLNGKHPMIFSKIDGFTAERR